MIVPDNPFARPGVRDVPAAERHDRLAEAEFCPVGEYPLSTFSANVDTASYADVRRVVQEGRLPPPEAVRIEEMINYFPYHYAQPAGDAPFTVSMEVAQCPWNGEHRLLRIGLQGRQVERKNRSPSNLVFLLDASGSMSEPDKLPLAKQAMKMLAEQLGENDRLAIVTYADTADLHLESTVAAQKRKILDQIESLHASGSTHAAAGIKLAYKEAAKHFVEHGANRVILVTDGDLDAGVTGDEDLMRLVQDQAKRGVLLTVLGVGAGNLKDSTLEKLAGRGGGAYACIDNLREARRVLIGQMLGSLATIAKDVKIQIEFNPAEVTAYRLIGYESRRLAARDFDTGVQIAGDVGTGRAITALYELVPAPGSPTASSPSRPPKNQRGPEGNLTLLTKGGDLATLRLGYTEPDSNRSRHVEVAAKDAGKRVDEASGDLRFAAAVASFGMFLRGWEPSANAGLAAIEQLAASALADDPGGYRAEFLDLVRRAQQIRLP